MAYSVQQVMVCVARSDGGPAVAPCGVDSAGVGYQPGVQSVAVLDASTVALLDANSGPLDYGQVAAIWGFAFATIISFWVVGKSAGAILAALR